MKTFGKVMLGLVGFIALVVGGAFWLTSGIVKQADLFFDHVGQKNYEAAYDMTSQEFRTISSMEDIEAVLAPYELENLDFTTWTSREVENGMGRVVGTLTLKDGTVYNAEMQFSKEDGEWKVLYVEVN